MPLIAAPADDERRGALWGWATSPTPLTQHSEARSLGCAGAFAKPLGTTACEPWLRYPAQPS